MTNSYSGDDAFKELQSGSPSPANTLDLSAERRAEGGSAMSSRNTLQKHHSNQDDDTPKGLKRFSKRQSKSGLAAVF